MMIRERGKKIFPEHPLSTTTLIDTIKLLSLNQKSLILIRFRLKTSEITKLLGFTPRKVGVEEGGGGGSKRMVEEEKGVGEEGGGGGSKSKMEEEDGVGKEEVGGGGSKSKVKE